MTTLINTPQGVIAVVDERPKEGDWAYSYRLNIITKIENEWEQISHNESDSHKVIGAENIEGVKILKLSINKRYALNNNVESVYKKKLKQAFGKPYEYTETEKFIIIKL